MFGLVFFGAIFGSKAGTDPRVLSGRIVLPADGASLRRSNFSKTTVSESVTERWYRIKAPAASVLNVTVTGPFFVPQNGMNGKSSALRELTANVGCELRDVNDQVVASSDHSDSSAEFLRRVPVVAGVYFLRVFYTGSVIVPGPLGFPTLSTQTKFLVLLSAGPDWDVVENSDESGAPHEAHHVGLLALPGRGPLVPGRTTWITTHGRSDEPGRGVDGPGTFFKIAKALARRDPAAQQALLDWTTAAAPKSFIDISEGRWFPKIGDALGERLTDAARFTGAQISVVGHSWGAYVNYEIAHSLAGPQMAGMVNRCIVLDPAFIAENYTVTDADFSADAAYSFALSTSTFGNETVAQTANDAFKIDVNADDVLQEHNAAHYFFQDLLDQSDRISTEFRNAVLNNGNALWERNPGAQGHSYDRKINAAGNVVPHAPVSAEQDYEGTLGIRNIDGHWLPSRLLFTAP